MGIDGAVEDGQAETRGENVFKLDPEESGVWFLGLHWSRSLRAGFEECTADSG